MWQRVNDLPMSCSPRTIAQEIIVASYELDAAAGGSDLERGGHRPPLQRRRNELLLAAAPQAKHCTGVAHGTSGGGVHGDGSVV